MTYSRSRRDMGWFDPTPGGRGWDDAEIALARHPELAPVIRQVGPCTLQPRRDHFVVLLRSVFSQQLATATAHTLFERFRDLFPLRRPTPARVHAALSGQVDRRTLEHCGLSRQKRRYVLDLSAHYMDGRIQSRRLRHASDEEVIEILTRVRGIGVWTAQMFMLFAMARADVWPVLDLGLQKGLQRCFGLPDRPAPRVAAGLGERFRPWRSVATWYLWRSATLPPEPVRTCDERTKFRNGGKDRDPAGSNEDPGV